MMLVPIAELKGWIRLFCFTAVVSIIVQVSWFYGGYMLTLSRKSVCDSQTPIYVKRILSCSNDLSYKRSLISSSANKFGYFIDPLVIEPWSDENGQAVETSHPQVVMPTKKPSAASYAEGIAALKAAVNARNNGKLKKAEIIIQHALALAPDHPDILTEYGFLLELASNNVVQAEEFYFRALTHNPNHSEALIRRAEALPAVQEIDRKMLDNLHKKRMYFLNIPHTNSALRRAMRESYFMHIYHTVALEGNTMTLYQTRSILETRIAVAGKSIMEHNEIIGMDAALRFLNQSLVHVGSITMQDILDIHRRVLGYVDPESAGVFRKTQVFVGNFVPVKSSLVESELNELVLWINQETMYMDPVELAAIAHYKLVHIHPFIDGNGRTARLLMNLILMQAGFPPVIIPVDSRSDYYRTLISANNGDIRPFIRFIARQIDLTLQMYISAANTCDVPSNECTTQQQELTATLSTENLKPNN